MSIFSFDSIEEENEWFKNRIVELEKENARLKQLLSDPIGSQKATPSLVSKIQAETKQRYNWWKSNQ